MSGTVNGGATPPIGEGAAAGASVPLTGGATPDGEVFEAGDPRLRLRPVLHPPCEQCGESWAHAPECEGEPRGETLAQALSRARKLADGRLRERVRRYLEVELPRQGSQPRGKFCAQCRETPRYPDHHCREHTAYLVGPRLEAERVDSDPEAWLDVWRLFFERVDLLLKT